MRTRRLPFPPACVTAAKALMSHLITVLTWRHLHASTQSQSSRHLLKTGSQPYVTKITRFTQNLHGVIYIWYPATIITVYSLAPHSGHRKWHFSRSSSVQPSQKFKAMMTSFLWECRDCRSPRSAQECEGLFSCCSFLIGSLPNSSLPNIFVSFLSFDKSVNRFCHSFCHHKLFFILLSSQFRQWKNVIDENYDGHYSSTKLTLTCT